MKKIALLFCLCLHCHILFSQSENLQYRNRDSAIHFLPAVTLENPLGSGKFGVVVFGGVIQNKTRLANRPDANAGIYIGLGEPVKFIGAGVTINIYGLSNKIGEQRNLGSGALNLHLNKFILNERLEINAGVDNALLWGNYIDKQYLSYQRSFYVTSNYVFYFSPDHAGNAFSLLNITAGLGNGYYRRDESYTNPGSGAFEPFISLATPVVKRTNLITEWNGYDVGAGVSSIPFQKAPFMFQVEFTDFVFGKPRIVSSISLPFTFRKQSAGAGLRPVRITAIRPARTI